MRTRPDAPAAPVIVFAVPDFKVTAEPVAAPGVSEYAVEFIGK
jgi:hypothetical protein